jgi:putative flippase GtrA
MFLLKKLHASLHGRYGIVFVVSTLVEVAVFAAVVDVTGWTTWATIVATVIALVVNFFGHVHYTFRGHPRNPVLWGFYLALKIAIVFLRNVLFIFLVAWLDLSAWFSYSVSVLIGFVSLIGTKWFIGGMSPRDQFEALRNGCIAAWMLYIVYKQK